MHGFAACLARSAGCLAGWLAGPCYPPARSPARLCCPFAAVLGSWRSWSAGCSPPRLPWSSSTGSWTGGLEGVAALRCCCAALPLCRAAGCIAGLAADACGGAGRQPPALASSGAASAARLPRIPPHPPVLLCHPFAASPEFLGAGVGALEAVQTRLYSDEARGGWCLPLPAAPPCCSALPPASAWRCHRCCCSVRARACARGQAAGAARPRRLPGRQRPPFLTALPCHPATHRCHALLQEIKTKKRYCRLQKAMGDHCLLAGSPLDAQDHYGTGAWRGWRGGWGQQAAGSAAASAAADCCIAATAAARPPVPRCSARRRTCPPRRPSAPRCRPRQRRSWAAPPATGCTLQQRWRATPPPRCCTPR